MNAPAADLLVFIDVICPWCLVGKRRLERALTMIEPDAARVTWLPFELNPDMPKTGMERRDYRTRKFGSSERSAQLDACDRCVAKSVRRFELFERTLQVALVPKLDALVVELAGRLDVRSRSLCICRRRHA